MTNFSEELGATLIGSAIAVNEIVPKVEGITETIWVDSVPGIPAHFLSL